MSKQFKPEDVATHRSAYKVILARGRKFVNTTVLSEFTWTRYTHHLRDMIQQLGDEHASLEEGTAHVEQPPKRTD